MHDSRGVRRGQGVGDLDGIAQRFREPRPAARDDVVQRAARHQLHGDVVAAVF